ncbi:SH3 domain-containing protein [Novosphingobium sp.]|uniref:SH3 domain-containing protein n=1 Tax=Novosphingobium sp. TaxID=1874826 RepID=UPI0035AEA61B
MIRSVLALIAAAVLASSTLLAPATAEDVATPYWASIRSEEVNMRVGPGEDYRILWVYRRAHLPLRVLRIKEGWRLVQDPDGAQGWVLARFLTRERTAYVAGNGLAEMRESASAGSRLLWKVEPGVIGFLGDCSNGWCAFAVDGRKGFVEQSRLWGAGEP